MSCVYALRFKNIIENNKISSSRDKCEESRSEWRTSWTSGTSGTCSTYACGTKIGEGTFGQVFKAKHTKTCEDVAIKQISCRTNKCEALIVNEIKLLKLMKHNNIINLIDICRAKDLTRLDSSAILNRYLVFEFCDYDLCELLYDNKVKFSLGEVKNILYQFFEGLSYIHQIGVIHRDLKPANILLTKTGTVKIADFGLAISLDEYSPNGLSSKVVTLAYRPPELLLGHVYYGTCVDMWSAGCIMAEMWTRTPLLPGCNEIDQLLRISELCGSINFLTLFGQNSHSSSHYMPKIYPRRVRETIANVIDNSCVADLLDQLLVINPSNRISARLALKHLFFTSEPKACDISNTLYNLN